MKDNAYKLLCDECKKMVMGVYGKGPDPFGVVELRFCDDCFPEVEKYLTENLGPAEASMAGLRVMRR